MMDSAVSAFSIYKNTKKPKKVNKKRKHNKRALAHKTLPENIPPGVMKNVAQKMKKQLKKAKGSKNRIEKQNYSKKNGMNKKPNILKKAVLVNNSSLSDEDDIPVLVPAVPPQHNILTADDVQSQSSCSSIEFVRVETDSRVEGLKAFDWLIAPYEAEEFLKNVWEKKPLHIARNKTTYYSEIISTPIIDDVLRNESIQFTKNIDVTSYVDEKRETHNPEGRAHPHLVWDFYLDGCSIRLLNPQTYMPKLHLLNATLQEFFNSFVGANAYLTPPDSQGFAPHYDDIEAFILQAEGRKHWRIYKPLNQNELLPRVSSKNFDQNEIGEPIMEVTLQPGDMLYFPRGYIHQGVTIDGEHSLHVTVSMYQKHSWADLLEKLVPAALQLAIRSNVELREGLPLDLYDHYGLVNSDMVTLRRREMGDIIKSLFDQIKDHLPIDEAVDQMAKNFQHDALPPVLTDLEKAVTVFGDSDVMINGRVSNRVELSLDTKIRLLRKNILRMVTEENIRLYTYVENSLEYHGNELTYLDIEEHLAPAIETLITSYPDYVAVENLNSPNDSDKLDIANALWGRGLIMTELPLESIDDD